MLYQKEGVVFISMAMDKDKNEKNNNNVVAFEQTKRSRQKQNTSASDNKPVKRRRNRPDLEKFGEEFTEPGDNARYLRFARVSMSLPPIDISDPKQVEKRINEYFDFCEVNNRPPNMVGLGNWLGVGVRTINRWKAGDWDVDTVGEVVQRALSVIEESLVTQVQNNPKAMVGGMFLLKSMFHYREQQDIVITTGAQNDAEMSADEIAKRYLEDGKTVETEFVEGQNGE